MSLYRDHSHQKVKIPDGQTTSEVVKTPAHVLFAYALPAGFEGTEMTFQVSHRPEGDFQLLQDELGAPVRTPVVAGKSYAVPAALSPWPYWMLVSNQPQSGVSEIIIVAKG